MANVSDPVVLQQVGGLVGGAYASVCPACAADAAVVAAYVIQAVGLSAQQRKVQCVDLLALYSVHACVEGVM